MSLLPQATFSPLFSSFSSLDSCTSSSCYLRLLFSHTIWMLCQVRTFILPHNCLTQHGANRCWSMSVARHNLQRCILTTAAYTVHVQWSSHQACAMYVLAKYCFLTYLFKVPKSLYKQVSRWTEKGLSFTTETTQGSEQSLVCTM
jgi:hypothetical protein